MLKKLKQTLIVAVVSVFGFLLVAPAPVLALDEATEKAACEGIGVVDSSCGTEASGSKVNNLVSAVINILSWIVGIAAVIMLIVGGFKYVTSAGDANATKSAKDTILYAIIGAVIALMAQALVRFVLKRTS